MECRKVVRQQDIGDGENEKHTVDEQTIYDHNGTSISGGFSTIVADDTQIFSMHDVDPVLDAKMRLVNRVQSPLQPFLPGLLFLLLCRLSTKLGSPDYI